METLEYWNTFTQGMDPAEFVWRYGGGNSEGAVQEYLQRYPSFMGIMRVGSWKETFTSKDQQRREAVATALRIHLEDTRDDWQEKVEECRRIEAQRRAEAKARAEAEALAAAVARVEAEARARAEAQRISEEGQAEAEPVENAPLPVETADADVAPVPEPITEEMHPSETVSSTGEGREDVHETPPVEAGMPDAEAPAPTEERL